MQVKRSRKKIKSSTRYCPSLVITWLVLANRTNNYFTTRTNLSVLFKGKTQKHTRTYPRHVSRVWRRAHMHFRGVPLIQHEIQFKTWSASCSPTLIECQISTENRAGLLRRTYVDVSASKRAFEKYVCLHGLFSSLVLGKCLEWFCKCCTYFYSVVIVF